MSIVAIDIAQMKRAKPRHYGRWLGALVLLLCLGYLVYAFAVGKIDWGTVGNYLFHPRILWAVGMTIFLSVVSMTIGVIIGTFTALGRSSRNPVISSIAAFYTWLFRGAPILLQLLIWYNLALIFPVIGIPGIWEADTVRIMSPLAAALIAFSLHEGAYTSEVIRSGLLSVDAGQHEAAKSIGMSYGLAFRRIIGPQALRIVIPPLSNEFIGLLKMSALASVIGFLELTGTAQDIYYVNTKIMEMLFVATAWYLVVVSMFSLGQFWLERRLARGFVYGGKHG
ncbi:amino acid ABC transporter permease [Devosia naphthalenivorans]|uniref:amino acid ABC transporter permease n=1 Tax=Devosia naphthalenivorans TaxID=2082392 RepID=UPI000D3B0344|nr:amino acid ABC transporter permease [Devosia naphthalenivorans]